MSYRASPYLRRGQTFAILAGIAGVIAISALWLGPPPPLEGARPGAVVSDRHGEPLRAFLSHDDKRRRPVNPSAVDPLLIDLLIAIEDQRFHSHPGVDPLALIRAAGQAAAAGHVVSGGSTLTMQAMRLLEPKPRTLASKLREIAAALRFERAYGKHAALRVWLARAPYGGNLEGVTAASHAFFGKGPSLLTPAQAALLVAIPRAPEALRPDRHRADARRARDAVLARAAAMGALEEAAARAAMAEPLPAPPAPAPIRAAHLAERLAVEGESLRTTLDLRWQAAAEAVAADAAQAAGPKASAAIVVGDCASGDLRVWVGGPDYFDAERAGMVDMAAAWRSPGSTLKPFIYGLAFAHGLSHPNAAVIDAKADFGGYAPENFDGGFAGALTVADALRRSLNLPAVAALRAVGPRVLAARLDEAGLTLRFPGEAGLPLALGGAGARLGDLTRAYCAFAGDGDAPAAWRARADDPAPVRARLLPESAADQVFAILATTPGPNLFAPKRLSDRPLLAFKTGTAAGRRDALAIGVAGGHALGVWVGRPDGAPCASCIGIEAAAPALHRLVAALDLPSAPGETGRLAVLREPAPAAERPAPAPTPGLRVAFPPSDGVILLREGQETPLSAAGGTAPLRWLANGRPLPAGAQRWAPEAPGRHRLTVIAADGASADTTVTVTRR